MNTKKLMDMALQMVGWEKDELPADCEIYQPGDDIKRVLFGIDITPAELYIAKQMGYDCVIAHHPSGSLKTFYEILKVHVDLMVANGVDSEVAEEAITKLYNANVLRAMTNNNEHIPSVARLLNMPFLNIHFPLDELGRKIMQEKVDELPEEKTVRQVMNKLNEIDVLRNAFHPMQLVHGDMDSKVKKVVIAHGAGTNGGYPVAKAYFDSGVDVVVYIHISPQDLDKLKTLDYGNLIVTGHIPGDLVGIKPFVDLLRESGIEVTCISGMEEL